MLVPEASVNKNGDAPSWKNYIRLAREFRSRSGKPSFVQKTPQRAFWARIATPYASHILDLVIVRRCERGLTQECSVSYGIYAGMFLVAQAILRTPRLIRPPYLFDDAVFQRMKERIRKVVILSI